MINVTNGNDDLVDGVLALGINACTAASVQQMILTYQADVVL